MATHRGLPKVRRHNLEDMEALLAVFNHIQIVIMRMETLNENTHKIMFASARTGYWNVASKIVLRNC